MRKRPQARTHCPQGHLLAAPNLVAHAQRDGHRECLACNRARGWLQHRAGQGYEHQAVSDEYYTNIMEEQDNG